MDFDTLSIVKFGDVDSLNEFLFVNGIQHQVFRETFFDLGIQVPAYPISDADPSNLDDWLQAHQVEHQAFANLLGLDNPFDMLDVDFNDESDFYDWLANHLAIHQAIAANLGLT
jgi:hypothetical protein